MLIGIDASRAVAARRTGVEGYAFQLIQHLLPLAGARGHTLRLYVNLPNGAPHPFALSQPHHVVYLPWPRLWTHLRLAVALHRRPPSLFFTPAHVIPFSYRGVSVATVHDLGYHHFPEAHPRAQRLYLRWSTQHNARRARLTLVDSEATRADLIRFYAIPPAAIRVVYPGVDPQLTRPAATDIKAALARYGMPRPYLLYLGTLQPRKNLARLVQAFARSAEAHAHHLVLAGRSGWLAQTMMDAIQTLPQAVQARIHLPGFVAEQDKAAILSGATALLYPSLYEGFGFPVLEAQRCGVPVLCANSSSLPEVAGQAALLVDPQDEDALTDGITRLATDAALRHRLVALGYTNVTRFDWATAAAATLSVLEEAAA